MNDLVKRLRDTSCNREPFTPEHVQCRCRLANEAADRIELLHQELARVRKAHKAIHNEIIYGGGEFGEPDIDRIHDLAQVGLRDMIANKPAEVEQIQDTGTCGCDQMGSKR